jgi:hypothetical protein
VSQPTTEPDRATEPLGVTTGWLGGLVVSGIGLGLAVVALTLPWISVQVRPHESAVPLPVTSLAGYGPTFALLLVLTAVAAAAGFAAGRRPAVMLRIVAVLLGPQPAVAALFVGLRPDRAALRDALTEIGQLQNSPDALAKDLPVSMNGGLGLYIIGLLLMGLGLVVAALNSSGRIALLPTPGSAVPQRQVALVHWVALIAAVPLIVLSLTLAWFEVDTRDGGMPAVAAGWHTVYRIGLIGALVLLVGTAVTAGGVRRVLRAAGLYVCGGLIAVLSINALLLWDPSGLTNRISVELGYLRLGPAYLAAIAAAPLLLIVLGMSAPISATPKPGQDDTDPDNADEQAGVRA